MKSFSPPIRFIVAIIAIWVGFRLVTFTPLYPDRSGTNPGQRARHAEALARAVGRSSMSDHEMPPILPASEIARAGRTGSRPDLSAPFRHALVGGWRPTLLESRPADRGATEKSMSSSRRPSAGIGADASQMSPPMVAPRDAGHQADPAVERSFAIAADRLSPWSVTGWVLWRSGSGTPPLASGGQLGDSQAGIRLTYRLLGNAGQGVSASGRISRPVRGANGAEAAIGLSLRPHDGLPIEILAERRIALERGGRDAWALGAAGGFDGVPLPLGFELAGWVQAGVVGAHSRDPYADGAIAIRRPVWRAGRATVALGGGGWAAAQPGATRIDIGPEASVSFPIADGTMRLGVGWRERVAGNAAPGSGPALALTTEF